MMSHFTKFGSFFICHILSWFSVGRGCGRGPEVPPPAPSKLLVARTLCDLAQAGATVVLATHDLTFAALVADAATMLFDGEAVCTEPAAAFFAGNLFYRPTEDAFSRLWREERS